MANRYIWWYGCQIFYLDILCTCTLYMLSIWGAHNLNTFFFSVISSSSRGPNSIFKGVITWVCKRSRRAPPRPWTKSHYERGGGIRSLMVGPWKETCFFRFPLYIMSFVSFRTQCCAKSSVTKWYIRRSFLSFLDIVIYVCVQNAFFSARSFHGNTY